MGGKTRIEALDHAHLKKRLRYDLMTGEFTWKKKDTAVYARWNAKYAEKPTGFVSVPHSGYRCRRIHFAGRNYTASRLAWYWMLARWPVAEIDHINQDPFDNRWINLREASSNENVRNKSRYKSNTSGMTGVSWRKNRAKWCVQITFEKKKIYGGMFDDFEEACARRKQLEAEYGFHENHGT